MNRFFYLFFIFCLILFTGCVPSGQIDTLESGVTSLAMEKTQDKIIEELQKNNEFNNKKYASLKSELNGLRATIQKLKRIIEETDFKVKILDNKNDNKAKDKKIEDLNNKVIEISKHIIELEQYIGIESSKPVNVKNSEINDEAISIDIEQKVDNNNKIADLKTNTKAGKESSEAIYKSAKYLFDKKKYDDARLEFERFINLFPDSKNADNARFWIADSYYREKRYEKAILEYQKVIEKYSTGNKVVSAYLKQSYSFAELGEKANARLILKELIRKYPDSKEAGFAMKKLESLK